MSKRAFAIACHPDDLEFGMMGTMMLLKDAGYEVHYMNVSNGSLGTDHHDYQTIVRMRREEALNSAKLVGAVFHESICASKYSTTTRIWRNWCRSSVKSNPKSF